MPLRRGFPQNTEFYTVAKPNLLVYTAEVDNFSVHDK
jgi:hypothetical protein